jgi:hypothetical protein
MGISFKNIVAQLIFNCPILEIIYPGNDPWVKNSWLHLCINEIESNQMQGCGYE